MASCIKVELLSDATFSRGVGTAGEVDVEIVHDEWGLPFLPGKTLRGLLRESWLALRPHFGGYEERARQVLGLARDLTPGGLSRLRIDDAQLPADVRAWAGLATRRDSHPVSSRDVLLAFSDIRRQTARDRSTGAPRDETLRASRVALQGLELEAPIRAAAFDDLDWDVLALSCLGVRHAGWSRNRGRGHVRLRLVDGDRDRTKELATRLRSEAEANDEGTQAEAPRTGAAPADQGPAAAGTAMTNRRPGPRTGDVSPPAGQPGGPGRATRFYRYRVTLRAPLMVPTLEGEPNSVRSGLRIPGGAIRGAVAAGLGASHPRFHELVLSGAIRYLNAYPTPAGAGSGATPDLDAHRPADGIGGRSIPTPAAWQTEKYNPTLIHDLSHVRRSGSGDLDLDGSDDRPQLEPLSARTPFVAVGARLSEARPVMETHFHHQRDRALGRATEERGAIFTYEAISGGTSFSGMVAVSGAGDDEIEERAERVREILDQPILLGRSRSTQYGGDPEITWEDGWLERELDGWSALLTHDVEPGDSFRLLLTADAVVRDAETGQPHPGKLHEAVVRALGEGRVKCLRVLGRATVVSGFNAAWRLPLPQAPAAAAGTLVVLEATQRIERQDLLEIERRGIGERLSEGLGACIFLKAADDPLVTVDSAGERPLPLQPPGVLPGILQEAQKRLWRSAMSRCVEKEAARVADGAEVIPNRSLLGRLRAPLREDDPGLTPLAKWLGSDENRTTLRRPAAEALAACRLPALKDRGAAARADTGGNGDPPGERAVTCLDQWLRRTLRASPEALDELARALFTGASLERYSLTGAVDADTERDLARQARGPLIDAVLATLARRSPRQPGEETADAD